MSGTPIEEQPEWAVCADCDGQLTFLVWGEGIDSSVSCENCDKKEVYR